MVAINKPMPKWKKAARASRIIFAVVMFLVTLIGMTAGAAVFRFGLQWHAEGLIYLTACMMFGVLVAGGLFYALISSPEWTRSTKKAIREFVNAWRD